MSDTQQFDLLTDEELQKRIAMFRSNPFSLEHTADCGLFALPVSPIFGGFSASTRLRYAVYDALQTFHYDERSVAGIIFSTWAVCDIIAQQGTYAQYDYYLPQLASGKRTGLSTRYFGTKGVTLHADHIESGYSLRGDTLTTGPVLDLSLLHLTAVLDGRVRSFIISATVLPAGTRTSYGRVFFKLRGLFVPSNALLGGQDQTPQSNEKWRAFRWKTDQSAS